MYFEFLVHFFMQFRNLVPPTPSAATRFVPNTQTLWDVLKKQTVGLVHLRQFKKGRNELAEQRDHTVAHKIQPIRSSGEGGEWVTCELVAERS